MRIWKLCASKQTIQLVFALIVFLISAFPSHAEGDVRTEYTPLTEELLKNESLIASLYLEAVDGVDNIENARILSDNIDKACFHDQLLLASPCGYGNDSACTKAIFLIGDCDSKSLALSMKIIDLEYKEKIKSINSDQAADEQPSSTPAYPVFAPPPITVFPLIGAPSFSTAGVSSRPACQTRCTSTWISCDKGCEAAPNYGNDPGFYDRQSSCHAMCRQSYSMCQNGC